MPSSTAKLKAIARYFGNPGWLCFLWFGLAAGMSLLAVPAVFNADSLGRAEALDAAREIFLLLGKAEVALLILFLVLTRATGRAARLWAFAGVLALIVIAQNAWLVPELSARTDSIIAGREPPPSFAHAAYSIVGLVKLVVLVVAGFLARTPTRGSASAT